MKKYIILLIIIIVSCNQKQKEDTALLIINDLISQPVTIIDINKKIQVSDFLICSIKQNPDSYILLLKRFKKYKIEGIYYSGEDNNNLTIEIIDEKGIWNLRFIFEKKESKIILKRLEADELMKIN